VLGTDETIKAMGSEGMRGYFNQRYSADNTVVALAGRVDFERAAEEIAGWCASWEPTRVGRDAKRPRVGAGEFTIRDAKVTRAYMLGMADGPAVQDDRRYAAALISQVLARRTTAVCTGR
jgi:predicted Zn-dependent peptidase